MRNHRRISSRTKKSPMNTHHIMLVNGALLAYTLSPVQCLVAKVFNRRLEDRTGASDSRGRRVG
jgi:hypothetical protein